MRFETRGGNPERSMGSSMNNILAERSTVLRTYGNRDRVVYLVTALPRRE